MCSGSSSVGLSPNNSPSKRRGQHILQLAFSNRECWTRCAGAHQKFDTSATILANRWRWGQRNNFLKGDVSWPRGHGGRREVGAFCEALLRARRPFNALFVQSGAAPGWWQFKHRSSKVNDFFFGRHFTSFVHRPGSGRCTCCFRGICWSRQTKIWNAGGSEVLKHPRRSHVGRLQTRFKRPWCYSRTPTVRCSAVEPKGRRAGPLV